MSEDSLRFIEQLGPGSGSGSDVSVDLQTCDRQQLVNLALAAGSKFKQLRSESAELRAAAQDHKSARVQLGRVSEQFSELQQAHLAQANFIQKLQKQQEKVSECLGRNLLCII